MHCCICEILLDSDQGVLIAVGLCGLMHACTIPPEASAAAPPPCCIIRLHLFCNMQLPHSS